MVPVPMLDHWLSLDVYRSAIPQAWVSQPVRYFRILLVVAAVAGLLWWISSNLFFTVGGPGDCHLTRQEIRKGAACQ